MNAILSGIAGGSFAFLNPWMLAGLAFLPVLWFLLRVTPPAPKRIRFPAAHFLAGLVPADHTASKTPWWILLLRLLIVALIIAALAKPVVNPGTALPGQGDIRIVIDNGWASAQNWNRIVQNAGDLIERASRERRPVHIMTTAPEPGGDKPVMHGPLSQGQAEAILRGLAPHPWLADYDAAETLAASLPPATSLHSFYFSSGVRDAGDQGALFSRLQNQGSLSVLTPAAPQLPLLLRPVKGAGQAVEVYVDTAPGSVDGVPSNVQVMGRDGRVIDMREAVLDTANLPQKVTLDIPEALRGQIAQIRISGRDGAGGVILLDDRFRRRAVGIAAPSGESQNAPLTEASFYLTRALSPYADLTTAPVQELIEAEPAVIILPDVGAMPAEDLNALEKWIRAGGLLLRFAGPNMSQGEEFLTPIPLRQGGRALEGALTWDEPVKLAPFPETSPYYGLAVPEDLTVKRQILADPVEGLEKKSWAMLADGTPLITADRMDKGLIVLVHTTATPEWSDLALSGVFVQILQRTVNLAGGQGDVDAAGGALQALVTMDGFGRTGPPPATVLPLPALEEAGTRIPDSTHPPGIYGRGGTTRSLNLGDALPPLRGLADLPLGVQAQIYGETHEIDLMPLILAAALALFFLDWLIMIGLQTGWRIGQSLSRRAGVAALFLVMCAMPAQAQDKPTDVLYASGPHLAYIVSGDAAVDRVTREGLEKLSQTLNRRTSVEPEGVVAVDPETDDLAFFPLIYWAVSDKAPELSGKAYGRIQDYLDHGGTILFDTRDGSTNLQLSRATGNAVALRRIAGSLNIQPLVQMPETHVLTKTFYLMRSTPGRFENGVLWVEEESASGRDGVSSVLIGSQDWASAWAAAESIDGINLYGGNRQEEMALRFGVNVVIYALTGNYKADQVHLPHILERLGQ